MTSPSIRRVSATMALLLGLGGCAFMPAYDTEYGAKVEKAGGLPKGNLVPALIAVGDKAAESGNRETALRIYGRAATINPQHPDSAQALARAELLVDQMPAPQSSPGAGLGENSMQSKALAASAHPLAWSQPRASAAPASAVQAIGSQEEPGAATKPAVQIRIIDLKSDESAVNTMIDKDKNRLADATPTAVPADATPSVPNASVPNASVPNASVPNAKVQNARPVVIPPALPESRRAADLTPVPAQAAVTETAANEAAPIPQKQTEEKYVTDYSDTISYDNPTSQDGPGDSRSGASSPDLTANQAAAPVATAEARDTSAVPAVASSDARTSDASPAIATEPGSTPSATIASSIKPPSETSDKQDASGFAGSALSAAEAAEVKRSESGATDPSQAAAKAAADHAAPAAEASAAPVSPTAAIAAQGLTAQGLTAEGRTAEAVGPDYQVQLAAYRSAALASQGWNRIKSASQGVLDVAKPVVVRAETPSQGTVYRLRLGGFDGRNAARAFCAELRSKSIDCFVAAADLGGSEAQLAQSGRATEPAGEILPRAADPEPAEVGRGSRT